MTVSDPQIKGVLKDVFETSTTKQVVVIIENLEGEMPLQAMLQAGELVSDITGVDYPRTIVDFPDGSRGLNFSVLGMTLKSGSKADWLKHRGQRVRILTRKS